MKNFQVYLLFSCLMLLQNTTFASHIVGAQLYYECVNANNFTYKITLKLYRDCLNGQAPFDDPITMFIFNGIGGALNQTVDIPKPPFTPQIQPANWGPCVAVPPAICVEEGVYETYINLPPLAGGYDLAWARCCRNYAITNLFDPQVEGVTFLAHIPDPGLATCNSMPIFNNTPPLFLCNNLTFNFDYSATDVDGDSLVYQLTNPYTGTNFAGLGAGNPAMGGNQPVVSPGVNPMGPPPYNNVVYGAAYNFINPFGAGSVISLDPQTGYFSVTPTQTGIYVFAVSVFEYRNGLLLSENKQDVQIHVLTCLPQNTPPALVHDLTGTNHIGDTIIVNATEPFCYDFIASVPVLVGALTVTPFSPILNAGGTISISGTNPKNGTICWTPPCSYIGQIVPVILDAYDTGNCPGFGHAQDTVWIKIVLPPNLAPTITPNYSGLNAQGNTIITTVNSNFCYNFVVQDIEGDAITINATSPVFSGANPPVITTTGTNPLTGTICWTPDCSYAGLLIPITFTATDVSACNVTHTVTSITNVLIQAPPSTPPVITTNLAGANFSNDTIYVNALSGFCYNFTGTDIESTDSLYVVGSSPIFNSANAPTITMTGINPVTGTVCWTPDCNYVGQTIPLILQVLSSGTCNALGEDFDTVYVTIAVPPNVAPITNFSLTGLNAVGNVVSTFAEDNFCFTFTATDANAGDSLTFSALSPIFTSANPPVVTFSGINPVTGTICWTPDCSYNGLQIPFIFGVKDNGKCNNSLSDYDTVLVNVTIPVNTAPIISHNLAGTNFSNDTIYINALSNFCYSFSVTDINAADSLNVYPLSPIFAGGGNAPTLTFSGVNPLNGQICWTPDCQYIDQIIPFVIEVTDNARCNTDLQDKDTVFIHVLVPPNTAPTATHDLTGNVFSNDTIYADALDNICYNILFNDINAGDTLAGFTISPIFSATNPASISFSGINPLQAQICWVPDCSTEGMTFPFIVRVDDNGKCNNTLSVYDTVWVVISDPITIPPLIAHDLTGTNHVGNTIYLHYTDSACYDFYIVDLTSENGMSYSFEAVNAMTGQPNGLAYATFAPTQGDTVWGTVCIRPTCANGGSTYDLIVIGTDKANCPPFDITRDTVRVKISTEFYAIASNDTFFCAGSGGVQLNVNPWGGFPPVFYYQWGCLNPLGCGISDPYIANPIVNPTSTSQVWVQMQDGQGCTSEIDTVLVTVYDLPIVDAGPDKFICENGWGTFLQGIVLNDTASPAPYQYSWFPSQGLSNDTIANPYAHPPVTSIYGLVVTDAHGCTSKFSTLDTLSTVIVNVLTQPIVNAGPSQHICKDDSTQLFGYASNGGTANYTYVWTPQVGLSNPNIASPTASPPFTTTYTLVAWANGCPSVGDTVIINVHTLPTANPGPIYDVCAGDSVQLVGIAGGDSTASYTFSWSPALGLSATNVENPWASPDSNQVYTLVAESNYGCISPSYDVLVQVLPTAVANAGNDTLICSGTQIQLNGSYVFANGSISSPIWWNWSPSASLSDASIANPMASPMQTTTYTLTTQVGACITSDEVKIAVIPSPNVAITADKTVLCSTDSVQMLGTGSLGAANFTWSPATHLNNPFIFNPIASPDTTTTYILTVQEGNCVASDSILIKVTPTPTADYVSTNPWGCNGIAEVYFQENASNELAYIWDFGDGTAVNNEPNVVHTFVGAGTYQITLIAISEGGCQDTFSGPAIQVFDSLQADFTSQPLPNDTVFLPNALIQFQNLSTNVFTAFWDFGDGQNSQEYSPSHIFAQQGNYEVVLYIKNEVGCTDSYTQMYHIAEPNLFIPNIFTPNQDGFFDAWLVLYEGNEKVKIEVFDRWGVLYYQSENVAEGWNGSLQNGKMASDGIYFYTVQIGSKVYNGNITLMK